MNSWTRMDVSSFNELNFDSVSNSINALVPSDMSEGKSDSLEMEEVATDFHKSFSLNSSNVSKTNHSRISVENIINSEDECLKGDEFRTATHPKVTEKDASIKELSSHLSITGVPLDNLDKKLKESGKHLNESKSHHHAEAGNDDLYALSNRLVSLSSDSSLDTDEDLEDALFKANLSHLRDFNGGKRIRARRSPRLSKIDPVTTIVCTRIQRNVSTKRKNGSKIAIAKEATSEVTSVASKSNFNPRSSNACGDGESSDDSVICLEDDGDYVDNGGVNSNRILNRENSVVDRCSSILNSKFQVYPKNNITLDISSFRHIVPPKVSSSVLASCKTLSSSNLAFSSSRIVLSSSSLTLYSSSVQMTSARISPSFPYQEFKSVFSDKRIDNLVPSTVRTIEPRPVAKLLCEIGSLFVNGYLSNNSTSHQKYKRIPSTVTICNSGKLEVTMDQTIHFGTEEMSMNDFKLMIRRCSCGFMTESASVLQHHYEFGRESGGLQHCCLCDDYSARYSSQFVRHMELEHDQKVRVLPKPWTYLCQLCTFETNGRAIHEKHVRNCQRLFSMKSNQRPNPSDCDIPILKTDVVKTEALSFGGEFVTSEAVTEMRNEPGLVPRPVDSTPEPKLLQIGNHLFVLMTKPTENMTTAASLGQCNNSQLSLLVNSDRVPQTTSAKDHDFASDDRMRPSCDTQTFPSEQLAPVLPVSLAMSVSSQDISPSGMRVSRLAAAAATKSVISNKPAPSKMAALPKMKTLTMPEQLSVESVTSVVSPSSDISKRAATQYAPDKATPSGKMNWTALNASSSASDVSRKCPVRVSKVQGNPSVSISEPNSLCHLSLPTTEPSKLRLLTDSTEIPLQVRSLRKEARNESHDPFVICPLCSGFVKDFECLETHMTICHKNVDASLAAIPCSQYIPVKRLPTTTTTAAPCKQQKDFDFGDNSVGHCPHCGLSGISDILAHVKEKHDSSLLRACDGRYCFLCHGLFESTKAFDRHVMESHNALGPDVSIFRKEIHASDARMMCPVCGKRDLFDLVRHMQNRHNVTMIEMLKLLFCNFCSYNSQDALDFESHMLDCHSDLFPSRDYLWDEIFTEQKSSRVPDPPSDEFGGTFKCSSCADEFVSASYRFRHEIMSHPHLPFVSSLFKKNLETGETLARRQNVDHLGSPALSCKRSGTDRFAKCNSSNGNSSSEAVNLCGSPETVVITDEEEEEEEIVEPHVKQPRLEIDRVSESGKCIPVENIEEVLEIDGETVIIVQERD